MSAAELRIRRLLLLLAAGIFLGTPLELWLHEHTDSGPQYIPFVLCALGVGMVALVGFVPQRLPRRIGRGAMLLIAAGGVFGVYEHLEGNFAFELEIRPNATESDVLMEALKGANPLLAPGVLAIAALIVLIALYQWPEQAPR